MKASRVMALGVLVATIGCGARDGEAPPAPEAAQSLQTTPAGNNEESGPSSRRDPQLDRSLTAVPGAWAAYAEGLPLERRLPLVAAANYRRALMLDPLFDPARLRLALVDTLVSRDTEAMASLRGIFDSGRALPEPYASIARSLAPFVSGDFESAAAAIAAALVANPDDADLHFLAGSVRGCSCDHFDLDQMVGHYERALAADPDFPFVRRRLSEAYASKGMHDWALSRAREYRASHPGRIEAIAEVGWVNIARGEYGEALEVADEIIRSGEDIYPYGLAPAWILSGQVASLAGMYDPERERRDTTEHNAVTHLHAGIAEVWSGRFDKALEHFTRGPEFLTAPWEKPDRALFFLLQARTLSLQGRVSEALAAVNAGQQIAGAHPALEYFLGALSLRLGDRGSAERVLNRLTQERRRGKPGWTEPWRRLMAAEIALSGGESQRALDEAQAAWSLARPLAYDCLVRQSDAWFLDVLGRAALAARRPEEALRAFEQIRSLGQGGLHQPDLAVLSLVNAGLAFEAMGRPVDAAGRYRQFLALWGEATEGPESIAQARASLSDLQNSRGQ